MSKVEVVLFDNDGTLVDTFDAIMASMHHALNEVLGHDLPSEQIASLVGLPLVKQMETFADDPDQVEALMASYRAHNEDGLNDKIATFAGLDEALTELVERGFRLGVVSSKRQRIVASGLRHFGLAKHFEMINGVEQSTGTKPGPEPLLNAAAMMGVEPWQCMYVGDSPYDLKAAHAAGMKCVAVTWGKFFEAKDLLNEEPTVIVTDPTRLVDAIGFAAV